jgi:ribonuclease HI/exonuclease III
LAVALNIKINLLMMDSSTPEKIEEFIFGEMGAERIIIFDKHETDIWTFPFLLTGGYRPKNTAIISHNTNGMNLQKLNSLVDILDTVSDIHDTKIILIQETHQTKFTDDRFERFALPGTTQKTGGVCIFAPRGKKTQTKTATVKSSKNGELLLQLMALQLINENNFPIFTAISTYITPNAKTTKQKLTETIRGLEDFMIEISSSNPLDQRHPIVLAGDLNIDPVRDRVAWEQIETTLKKFDLSTPQKNLNETSHTPPPPGKKARLDHIFFNQDTQISDITIHVNSTLGHSPMTAYCKFDLKATRKEKPISRTVDMEFLENMPEKLKKQSTDRIIARLDDICMHFNAANSQKQIDDLAEKCKNSLFDACRGIIPVREPWSENTKATQPGINTAPKPQGAPPFWTLSLTALKIKANNSAKKLREFDPFRFPANQRWKMKDRLTRKNIRDEKTYRNHYIELEDTFLRSRKMWDRIRDGLSHHGLPKHRNASTADAKLKPEKAHRAADIDFGFSPVPDEKSRWGEIEKYVNSNQRETNTVDYMGSSREITTGILQHAISKMSNTSCNGTDGISTKLLKLCCKSENWSRMFCNLINSATHHAIWPTSFDTAWVTTIYKGKDLPPDQANSFRRICVTPKLASVAESCINTTMFSDPNFDPERAYGRSQSGFVPGSGSLPQNAVIQMAMDQTRPGDTAIFSCDISQAFDSIPHISIIEGAIRAGCSRGSLRFIIRYLGIGYEQHGKRLKFPDSNLEPVHIRCGVIQGSPMSPNLYAMSQNRIDDCIPPACGIKISAGAPGIQAPAPLSAMRYADDTNIMAKTTRIHENSIARALHGDNTNPGLISTFKILGNKLNTRKSTLFIMKSTYDRNTQIGRSAFAPIDSTELPAQSPVRILGVDYFSHTDDENRAMSAKKLAQDPRQMRANIAGFDAYLSDANINAIERLNFLRLSLLPSSTYGAWISNFTGDFSSIDKSMLRGIRTILGIPVLSDPRDGYETIIPDQVIREYLGLWDMDTFAHYHRALILLQSVRSPIKQTREITMNEMIRAFRIDSPNTTLAGKVMRFLISVDPEGPPTLEQRSQLEMSTFLQNFIGKFTPKAGTRAAMYGPTRTLSPIFSTKQVYTDGSALNNGNSNRGGIGIFFGEDDPRNVSESVNDDNVTNNRTELMAILRCCQIVERGLPMGNCPTKFTINTDSQYAILICTVLCFTWANLNWNINKSNLDLIRKIYDIIVHLGPIISFNWVKAHAGIAGNTEADRFANEAAHRVAPVRPARLPFAQRELSPYIDAKKDLLNAVSVSLQNNKPKGKNRPPAFTAKLLHFIPDYIIFTMNAVSMTDNSRLKAGLPLLSRLCPLCNEGIDNTAHLLDCTSESANETRKIVPEEFRMETIQEMARLQRPPNFPNIKLAHEIGKMSKALLRARTVAHDIPHPRENLIPRPQANNATVFLSTFQHFRSPKKSPRVGPIWWEEDDLSTLFKKLGWTLELNQTRNCLCNAITGLLQANGLQIQDRAIFAQKLRHTLAEFIRTKYTRIMNTHRNLLATPDHDRKNEHRAARLIGETHDNEDEALSIKSVTIASSLFNASFECITIQDSMRDIDSRLSTIMIPEQNPRPPVAGTLVLLKGHWYFLTKSAN